MKPSRVGHALLFIVTGALSILSKFSVEYYGAIWFALASATLLDLKKLLGGSDRDVVQSPPMHAYFFAFIALVSSLGACTHPLPPATGKAINCIETSASHHLELIGAIDTCAQSKDVPTCLLGLIDPAVGVTEEVIACLANDQAHNFARASSLNTADVASAHGAEALQKFIASRGYTFASP